MKNIGKLKLFGGLVLAFGCLGAGAAKEIKHQPDAMPIMYGANLHEKELFGYEPSFDPPIVTFDPQNRPYIRRWDKGKNDCPSIQTLDKRGGWIDRSFRSFLPKEATPGHWTGTSDYGTVVDKDGDLYVLVDAASDETGLWYLMHSRNQGESWTPYRLPFGPMPGDYKGRTVDGNRALLQSNVRSGFLDHPPVVAGNAGSRLLMVVPEKDADGTLRIPAPVTIEDIQGDREVRFDAGWKSGWGGIGHDGQKKIASVGDNIFVVWARPVAVPGHQGTPIYIAQYNRTEKRFVVGSTWVGSNGVEVDSHNQPVVGVDGTGYIHVLLGSHGTMENNYETVLHTRSENPLDASSFTKPIRLPASGCTYPDLVIDRNDTLHVVCRRYEEYAHVVPETFSQGYVYKNKRPGDYSEGFPLYPRSQLAYFRKRAGEDWSFQPLVVTYFGTYVYWHNHISLDANDRIFVSYRYGPHINPALAQPADPAILFSPDGGDTWKLATTKDLHLNVEN